jgi:hypothetical protein
VQDRRVMVLFIRNTPQLYCENKRAYVSNLSVDQLPVSVFMRQRLACPTSSAAGFAAAV